MPSGCHAGTCLASSVAKRIRVSIKWFGSRRVLKLIREISSPTGPEVLWQFVQRGVTGRLRYAAVLGCLCDSGRDRNAAIRSENRQMLCIRDDRSSR